MPRDTSSCDTSSPIHLQSESPFGADGFTERHGVVQVLEQPRGARLDGHHLASDAAAGPLEANHKRLGASLVILTAFSTHGPQVPRRIPGAYRCRTNPRVWESPLRM